MNGFRGVYGAKKDYITDIFKGTLSIVNKDITSNRRKRQTVNGTENELSGIDDPITCLIVGQSIFFMVTNTSYPVYDKNNLVNSNPTFDHGPFDTLAERQLQSGDSTGFVFQFQEIGVYTFYLSNNPNRRIYFSVFPTSSQCPEIGPFFPLTPSRGAQLGLIRSSNILLEPNWVLIGGMVGGGSGLMILFVIALVSCRCV